MRWGRMCAALLLVLLLMGCGADRYTFQGDAFTISRNGRTTTITGQQKAIVCVLHATRVRKPRTEEEAAERRKMTVAADTDALTILCSGRVIVVIEKTTGEVFCFAEK